MAEEPKKPDAPQPPLEEGAAQANALDLSSAEDLHTFRMKKKATRHFVAHEEYGVLFSHCGMRIRRAEVQYDPPAGSAYELICVDCLEHTKRQKAAQMGRDRDLLKTDKD